MLHHLVVYDQVNIGNTAAAEAAAREVQTQELPYAEKVTGQLVDGSERHIRAGSRPYGNWCIMPGIREY